MLTARFIKDLSIKTEGTDMASKQRGIPTCVITGILK